MAEYRTVRFCHQDNLVKKNYKGSFGDEILIMNGHGGVAPHVHCDVSIGKNKSHSLKDFQNGKLKPDKKLLYKIINKDFFKVEPVITVDYLVKWYEKEYGVKHTAVDFVPFNRHQTRENFKGYWSLNYNFEVADVGVYSDGTTFMILWLDLEENMNKEPIGANKHNILQLDNDWQYDELYNVLKGFYDKGVLTSDEWHKKALNKVLTVDELAWLNTMIINRR